MDTILLTKNDLEGTVFEFHFEELKKLAQRKAKDINYILDCVAAYYGVSVKDICSDSRKRNLVNARSNFAFIAREIDLICGLRYKHSFQFIGTMVNRDHASVIQAIHRVKNDCIAPRFKKELKELIDSLFGTSGIEMFESVIKLHNGKA